MKYIIISNRLPVTLVEDGDSFTLTRSGGGLATGLDSLEIKAEKHWIGWPGLYVEDELKRKKIGHTLAEQNLHPVYLDPDHIKNYYEGYCNSILWPLCHYFFSYIEYNEEYWNAYKDVNELFCRAALKVIEPGDFIWINDYHLMLLPALIREQVQDVGIGYFHHIPFPSYELFRCLPERADLLHGLLGADLVAFHVHDYMRHFSSALYRVLNLSCNLDEVPLNNRIAQLDAFPMGINYELYHEEPCSASSIAFAQEMKTLAGDAKIILSVDRLDYSKGIPFRLQSYANLLKNHPEYKGKVTLFMIVVPSRDNIEMYSALKARIDEMIGELNGSCAFMGWTPVHYYYHSFDLPELSAMYNMADIAFVTPLRDGMNLVAKEYLAAKRERPGVLILSEMAGAAVELSDALIVNPMDTRQMENALLEALSMPEEEQSVALQNMQKTVARQNVNRWAKDYFTELHKAKNRNDALRVKILEKENIQRVAEAYKNAQKRFIALDYDGTLVPIVKNPSRASPTPSLLNLLASLAADPRNTVVIISGRDKETLDSWLGRLNINLAAEHGVFFKENGLWNEMGEYPAWNDEILAIFEQITDKTPRSVIERKKTALAWHYRNVDPWLADLRVTQLVSALLTPCSRIGLQIMRGKKIIEVKPSSCNKGTEMQRLLQKQDYDFILALGDDVTDEDMFAVLPAKAITVKVGQFSDSAMFCLPEQEQTLPFLTYLSGL
ncbi:MAG: bifunctional alpha,alpha-trehalose-phosphate synthase (UDP-forming)/trehalose-phosphatase [Deltaproteobacteria bacterium]|jgi:trehalose 6-phosphate synthase/phosphatase|nr:bifunctional alpha,alpha-trehalose-phosphate synthase (UDP-forming)/trehalose-phosphatase [Deltaproteobacteria bacterium]